MQFLLQIAIYMEIGNHNLKDSYSKEGLEEKLKQSKTHSTQVEKQSQMMLSNSSKWKTIS